MLLPKKLNSLAHAATLALVVSLLGCGSGDDSVALAPVSGKITKDGQPVPNAIVEFFPVDGRTSVGQTDTEGNYSLDYSDEKGAVIGPCRVQITPNASPVAAPDDGNDVIAPPMSEPVAIVQIPDNVTVTDGENTFDFDLAEYSGKE